MKFSLDKQERFTIFTLEETNLNSLIAPDIKSEFVILQNEGIPNLIVNLSKVHYVDSSGLSAILTGHRIWKQNGEFVLTGIQHAAVKKLIEISRLDNILTLVPTVEESIKYVTTEDATA